MKNYLKCKMSQMTKHHLFHPNHCAVTIWRLEWIFSLNLGFGGHRSLSSTSQSPSGNQTHRRRVAPQIQIQIQAQIHGTAQYKWRNTSPKTCLAEHATSITYEEKKRKRATVQIRRTLFSVKYQREVTLQKEPDWQFFPSYSSYYI